MRLRRAGVHAGGDDAVRKPLAPGSARALLRKALTEWAQSTADGADLLTGRVGDDAALVASELVTNAVVHAGTDVHLTCRLEEGTGALVVEVADRHLSRAPRDDAAEAPAHDIPEYGRGLRLVAALAESWGVTYRAGSKTVWARLPTREEAPADPPAAYAGERAPARDLRAAAVLSGDPLDPLAPRGHTGPRDGPREGPGTPGGPPPTATTGWPAAPDATPPGWAGARCPSSPRRPTCSPGSWTRTWSHPSPAS